MIKTRDNHKEIVRDFLSNEKMLKYEWEDLQEHCKKEIQKIVRFCQGNLNDSLKEWVCFYKVLGRVCQIKLKNFK